MLLGRTSPATSSHAPPHLAMWVDPLYSSLNAAMSMPTHVSEEHGLCYGVKRGAASRSGTSQNPQTPTPNLTPTKNTNHTFYSVRGDFWGMHRIDLKRDFKSKVCNHLIELQ